MSPFFLSLSLPPLLSLPLPRSCSRGPLDTLHRGEELVNERITSELEIVSMPPSGGKVHSDTLRR